MKSPAQSRVATALAALFSGPVFLVGLAAGGSAGGLLGVGLDPLLGHPLGRTAGFLSSIGYLAWILAPAGALLGAVGPTLAVLRFGGKVRGLGALGGLFGGTLAGAGVCWALRLEHTLSIGLALSVGASLGALAVVVPSLWTD